MKVEEKIEVSLTTKELEKLVREYVLQKHPGYKVDDIDFEISMETDPDDWDARYAPVPVMKGVDLVLIKGKE